MTTRKFSDLTREEIAALRRETIAAGESWVKARKIYQRFGVSAPSPDSEDRPIDPALRAFLRGEGG
jgi:hypothetical protein